MTAHDLTVVISSRDHPQRVSSQLRLFERANVPWPIVIADSSAGCDVSKLGPVAEGRVDYRQFAPATKFYDKLADAIAGLRTQFVLVTPDRKITLPHAVEVAVDHLTRHPDNAAANGYVIGFAHREGNFDVNRVIYFTPTIAEDDPLRRHYHLMRRYQPSLWALFRREALTTALAAARPIARSMFQEIMFMNALVLQGKLARLPLVFRLESEEHSSTPLRELDPLYWFLHDSASFAEHYRAYREALCQFILRQGITARTGVRQLIDTIHAVWLSYNFDPGVLNHAARLQLGDDIAPLPNLHERPRWRGVESGDVVHQDGARSFIWRRSVVEAEPRDEIRICVEEMRRAEQQLRVYFD